MSLFDTNDEAIDEAADASAKAEEAAIAEANSIRRKYTWMMGFMFFVEIMPLPFTAFFSIYTIRKRPEWFPLAVHSLYADIPMDGKNQKAVVDPLKTRKKCTITVFCMMLVDLGPIPLTIPVGVYIVRRRPKWFRNVVARLYADQEIGLGTVVAKQVRLYDD
jgi:hypothetical protein